MAKLHSRKKGKSGSKRPKLTGAPEWSSYSKEEVEEIVRKLAREGVSPTKIGLVLRDQYGVPLVSRVLGMKMKAFLEKEALTAKFRTTCSASSRPRWECGSTSRSILRIRTTRSSSCTWNPKSTESQNTILA